ncbi:sperm-tail PG-rich repeat-containing protein 2-like isoform X1 [Macrosteles quadrilineatus]|uniref:sperm-tail PG-rich repeat-containing protein 2-like isoform X1 n=1 Tax=Macrosteles quadrilineatus TaxID=74068 RepID=UPI0023E31997|nr:sperm-tail PG-rich repeat-containing protein 2-like isoform X1 [Macrosteles quadrilineatus]
MTELQGSVNISIQLLKMLDLLLTSCLIFLIKPPTVSVGLGGTTIQNRAPRFYYREKDYIAGPDLTREAKKLHGHIQRGTPPRNSSTKVTTIPEKGAEGYLDTEDGLVKIYNPPENKPVGPTTYYNPKGHDNFTTLQYKGNFWSHKTATRFKYKISDGPSPADYSINEKQESPWKKCQEQLRSRNQANAPSLRHDDVLLRKLCRENLPGPGAYSQNDSHLKKCECGVGGTFSKAKLRYVYLIPNNIVKFQRGSLHRTDDDGPGPAAYCDPRSSIERALPTVSPFNITAHRFAPSHQGPLPGPADYTPKFGLWNEVKKRENSRYSQFSAPFDSSSSRNTGTTKPDVLCIPGPDLYYPKFQQKGDKNQSSMFASGVERGLSIVNQNLPGPNTYSVSESIKLLSSHTSHLQQKCSAFLTSSERIKPLRRSYSPGPDTYDTTQSSLNSKSGVIGMKLRSKTVEITPGPAQYRIHPKYATSRVLDTSNVSLKHAPKGRKNKKKPKRGKNDQLL